MDSKDKLTLWLIGCSGCTQQQVIEILASERIKWELEQNLVDPVGLMNELPYGCSPKDAMEKLQFLQIFK